MDRLLEQDIKITADFDFEFENDDMKTAVGIDYVIQQVHNRIKTMNPDWFYDKIGSDLEQLLGQANEQETAKKGIALIRHCLTYDGFLQNEDIYIKPVPVNEETITYFAFIKTPFKDKPLAFQIEIALSAGINIKEV